MRNVVKPVNRTVMKEERRELVARLYLRRYSLREIVGMLESSGVTNPRTGQCYTLTTVHNDLRVMREQWKQNAAIDITAARSAHLAELAEVRRRAWRDGDLTIVLRALKQVADILGLEAAKVLEVVNWRLEAQQAGFDPALVFEQFVAQAAEVLGSDIGEPVALPVEHATVIDVTPVVVDSVSELDNYAQRLDGIGVLSDGTRVAVDTEAV